ncbi:MAG: DNA repair protein RecN, partial [Eubacteriales bacterium]
IQIHGQHDSQQLFDEANHLQYLDDFARNEKQREDYLLAFTAVQKTQGEIRKLSMDEGEKLRRMESLKGHIHEIEEADPKIGEDVQLEKQRKRLLNAEKLAVGLANAVEALYGGDDSDGACAMMKDAERAVLQLARLDDSIDPLGAKLTDLTYAVQDVTEELRDLRDELSFSEEELEQLEGRLEILKRLRRKYGGDCEKVLEYLQRARDELDEIEFSSDRMMRLEKILGKQRLAAEQAAMALRQTRQVGSEQLSARILSELSQLDMPKVQFTCEFMETDLTERGMDDLRFLMSANVGESLKPMSKVASGGELARIMLALKNVMAEQDAVETLIFDEVDAGISGQAAQKVANKLSAVATTKQILCVTHLAQIAAMADTHLYISKGERDGRTFTSVEPLDKNGRKAEIARIIGGAKITETTLKSAGEMLKT